LNKEQMVHNYQVRVSDFILKMSKEPLLDYDDVPANLEQINLS